MPGVKTARAISAGRDPSSAFLGIIFSSRSRPVYRPSSGAIFYVLEGPGRHRAAGTISRCRWTRSISMDGAIGLRAARATRTGCWRKKHRPRRRQVKLCSSPTLRRRRPMVVHELPPARTDHRCSKKPISTGYASEVQRFFRIPEGDRAGVGKKAFNGISKWIFPPPRDPVSSELDTSGTKTSKGHGAARALSHRRTAAGEPSLRRSKRSTSSLVNVHPGRRGDCPRSLLGDSFQETARLYDSRYGLDRGPTRFALFYGRQLRGVLVGARLRYSRKHVTDENMARGRMQ